MNVDIDSRRYEQVTASVRYSIGFDFKGDLYVVNTTTLNTIAKALKVERAATSKGGGEKIRIRFTTMIKACLIANKKAVKVGNADELKYEGMKNKGECFERWYYERNGLTWSKDSTPFWVAGDISLNGEEIQLKYDGATLVNEKTLARAEA